MVLQIQNRTTKSMCAVREGATTDVCKDVLLERILAENVKGLMI